MGQAMTLLNLQGDVELLMRIVSKSRGFYSDPVQHFWIGWEGSYMGSTEPKRSIRIFMNSSYGQPHPYDASAKVPNTCSSVAGRGKLHKHEPQRATRSIATTRQHAPIRSAMHSPHIPLVHNVQSTGTWFSVDGHMVPNPQTHGAESFNTWSRLLRASPMHSMNCG
ncbi:Uncharacterized protein Fot_40465 [Forsythia ovata]|uniref:Uncharacterized protein n=1 Tax=Forsythia ovata TaxID=205694 RepID=A0ABD1S8H6_9LAMI